MGLRQIGHGVWRAATRARGVAGQGWVASRGGVVLALLGAAACAERPPADAAGLVVETARQELGTLTEGVEREVVFPFRVEDAPVTVHAIDSSCGCVGVRLVAADGSPLPLGQPIPAGTSGAVRALWKTAGYQGERVSVLDLKGEGPGLPRTLRFTGTLEPWFTLVPPVAALGEAGRDAGLEAVVRVRAPEPFRLLDIAATLPPLTAEGLPSAEPAREQVVRVVVPPGAAEEGRHRGFLQIRTDQDGLVVQIPFDYTIASPVSFQPAGRLLLGRVQEGRSEADHVELRARVGRIEGLEAALDGLGGAGLDVVTLEEGARYHLRVDLSPDLAAGPLRGTIRVRLRHRLDGEEIPVEREIPVYGVVVRP